MGKNSRQRSLKKRLGKINAEVQQEQINIGQVVEETFTLQTQEAQLISQRAQLKSKLEQLFRDDLSQERALSVSNMAGLKAINLARKEGWWPNGEFSIAPDVSPADARKIRAKAIKCGIPENLQGQD